MLDDSCRISSMTLRVPNQVVFCFYLKNTSVVLCALSLIRICEVVNEDILYILYIIYILYTCIIYYMYISAMKELCKQKFALK